MVGAPSNDEVRSIGTTFALLLVNVLSPDDMQNYAALRDIFNVLIEGLWVPLQSTSVDLAPLNLRKRLDRPLDVPEEWRNELYMAVPLEQIEERYSTRFVEDVLKASRLVSGMDLKDLKEALFGFLLHVPEIQVIERVFEAIGPYLSARGIPQLVSLCIHNNSRSIYRFDGIVRDGRHVGVRLVWRYLEVRLGGDWKPKQSLVPKAPINIEDILNDENLRSKYATLGHFDEHF
jgi:hypothetical protein